MRSLSWIGILFLLKPVTAAAQAAPVKVLPYPEQHKVVILVDGRPFTSYLFPDTLEKPILYPIYSSGGALITRGFPIAPRPGEPTDHPHQAGLWFTYESVNGLDFWNNSYAIAPERKFRYGWIRQQQIIQAKSGVTGILKVAANWEDQKKEVLLKEVTTFKFSGTAHTRIIDRITTLTAAVPVTFKDVKDGLLGLRVAKPLQLPEGNYLTSEGKTGDSAWGTRARWCMLYGKLKGATTAIIIFDHPGNPGYPTYWHARGYGLFAANPLGAAAFTGGKKTTNYSLPEGKLMTFRYRIMIISGKKPGPEEINRYADAFASGH